MTGDWPWPRQNLTNSFQWHSKSDCGIKVKVSRWKPTKVSITFSCTKQKSYLQIKIFPHKIEHFHIVSVKRIFSENKFLVKVLITLIKKNWHISDWQKNNSVRGNFFLMYDILIKLIKWFFFLMLINQVFQTY